MVKAVIFDKDGVLMFTETIYHRAYQDTLKKYGIKKKYTWDTHRQVSGKPTVEVILTLKKMYGLKVSVDELITEYRNRYRKIFRENGLEVPSGVRELLSLLRVNGMLLAVATGASRESAGLTLEKTRLAEFFQVILTSSDVANGKPDPEIFLLAAERLNVDAHNCLVIGDSINDVLGAKSAGMRVIAITDKSYIEDPDLASPDLEVKKFSDITLDMIKLL